MTTEDWMQQEDNERRWVLLHNPQIKAYVDALPKPFIGQLACGHMVEDGVWAETPEQIKVVYDRMVEEAARIVQLAMEQTQVDPAAGADERKRQRMLKKEATELARQRWKNAVDNRRAIVAELDENVRKLHFEYVALRDGK